MNTRTSLVLVLGAAAMALLPSGGCSSSSSSSSTSTSGGASGPSAAEVDAYCQQSSPCPNDTRSTAAEVAKCVADAKDDSRACFDAQKAFNDCLYGKYTCGADGKASNALDAFAACGAQTDAIKTACPNTGGAGGGTSTSTGTSTDTSTDTTTDTTTDTDTDTGAGGGGV